MMKKVPHTHVNAIVKIKHKLHKNTSIKTVTITPSCSIAHHRVAIYLDLAASTVVIYPTSSQTLIA